MSSFGYASNDLSDSDDLFVATMYVVHCGTKYNYHVCGIFSTLRKAKDWVTNVGKTEYDHPVFCIVGQELDREFSYGNDESLFCWLDDTWYADVGVDDVLEKAKDMGFRTGSADLHRI